MLFLFNAACSAEKQQMPNFVVFGLIRLGLEPTIYRTQGEHAKKGNAKRGVSPRLKIWLSDLENQ